MRFPRTIVKSLVVVWILTCLLGCVTQPKKKVSWENGKNDYATPPPPVTEEGSLWSSQSPPSLYADIKARNVDDIITVNIVESARASKNATTKTERDSELEATWTGIFDQIASKYTINGAPLSASSNINFINDFDGKGETTRNSYMTAFITARVIKVLPNGQMVIRGFREVQVNNENQFIFLEGVIRSEDVSSNNVILSTYIADAVIELTGSGSVSDKQQPGWLARALDWAWPF